MGILILNYNNVKDIKECIDSLVRHIDISIVKLLVVDNGSTINNSQEVADYLNTRFGEIQEIQKPDSVSKLGQVSYFRLTKNLGYARGNNEGLNCFYNDHEVNYIMILNSDIIITEDFIPTLKEHLSCHKELAVVSPLLYKRNGEVDYCCARRSLNKTDLLKTFSSVFNKKYMRALDDQKILKGAPNALLKESVDIEFPSGSCMMFHKEVLQKIGGFDPNTFLYYEENILCRKIQKLGMKCALIPSVSCIHTGGATTTSVKTAYFLKKCNLESLLYYLKMYEDCSELEIFYVLLTGRLRLLRLRLGEKVKRFKSNS